MPAASLNSLSVQVALSGRRNAATVQVLDDVDLRVEAGQITALLGESGCGKSMVAAALCGLLPPGSTIRGSVTVGEHTLRGDDAGWPRLRGRHIGLVPQSPSTSFTPVRTIGSQLDEVVRILDGPRTPAELCAEAGLASSALDLYPHELSGGMVQRAAVAAALAGSPEVVVADEPTSALDPDLADGVWDLLKAQSARGTAVLVITHDMDSLRRAALGPSGSSSELRSIAMMRRGRVITQQTPSELLRSAAGDEYLSAYFSEVCV
ncbi:MAG: ATP-binding cassette domain-containing protein [Gordonia sp. (in: high G+C Gram-positive bacteria)]